MIVERLDTDVLCVGGGIASLMAAIRASEMKAKVIVADKGNTLYSGNGGAGCDHFMCYYPPVHGSDIEPIVEGVQRSLLGRLRHRDHVRALMAQSFEIATLWEKWGIPMKYEGKYEFSGHALPGETSLFLHYSGKSQKKVLTQQAIDSGATVINRVMIFELLRDDNGIVGAIGIHTRENKLLEIHAKSVVLGTGDCVRLYPSPYNGEMFNLAHCPALTGDGRAMAYRVGAELAAMELPNRWVGPRYFARCGKATWVGVLKDFDGNPIGPFLAKPDKRYGDRAADVFPTIFQDSRKNGKWPIYMDCSGISEEDYKYMMYFLIHEGNASFLKNLNEEGIDIRVNPVEFDQYEIMPRGGVKINGRGETSVKGLFAAGDEQFEGGGVSPAATIGWFAGEEAAKRAELNETDIGQATAKIEETRSLIEKIQDRKVGANWKEANLALQQIMNDYAGAIRSEISLEVGREYLKRFRNKVYTTMSATNQHELIHCLEVLNLLDLGEIIMAISEERKETRGLFVRADFPYANPMLDNRLLVVKKVNGAPVQEWQFTKQ